MKKMIRFGVCMTLTASMLFSSVAFAAEGNVPKEKIDEVLVQTDASGNITQMQDYVTLVGANSTDTILDKTKLTDIKNMSGDETFKDNGDGTICWQNKGNEIRYIGNLNADLPVSMKVTYYLDDQEISPEELAGKSGRVKVMYNFENLSPETIQFEGENIDTYVPFLTVTSVSMPMDSFSNVEPLDGSIAVKEFGDRYFMLGVTSPGTMEALNFSILGLDEYVKVPSSFGFVADVTNFHMPATVTCITPHILDMLDLDWVKTKDDMAAKVDELVDATKQIVDGSNQLSDGTGQLSDGAKQFYTGLAEGLEQISNGSMQFDNNLDVLETKKADLQSQATELLDALNDIMAKVDQYQLPEVNDIMSPQLFAAIDQLNKDASDLKTQLTSMQTLVESAQTLIIRLEGMLKTFETIKGEVDKIDVKQIMDAATTRVSDTAKTVIKREYPILTMNISDEKMDELINEIIKESKLNEITNSVNDKLKQIKEIMADIKLSDEEKETINELKKLDLKAITDIVTDMQTQFTVLQNAEGKKDEIQDLLDSANNLLNEVKANSGDIEKKSGELASGLDFADSMIKEARSYIQTLDSAVGEAKDGSEQLSDGANRLDDGAKELASGTKKYYNEGILTAADYAKQATLTAIIKRGKAHQMAADKYTNISGIDATTQGEIKFTLYTAAIGEDATN